MGLCFSALFGPPPQTRYSRHRHRRHSSSSDEMQPTYLRYPHNLPPVLEEDGEDVEDDDSWIFRGSNDGGDGEIQVVDADPWISTGTLCFGCAYLFSSQSRQGVPDDFAVQTTDLQLKSSP